MSAESGEKSANHRDPAALSAADLARLLGAAGGKAIDVEKIEADVSAGAPTNGDGTINLVHYTAWLVKQMGLNKEE